MWRNMNAHLRVIRVGPVRTFFIGIAKPPPPPHHHYTHRPPTLASSVITQTLPLSTRNSRSYSRSIFTRRTTHLNCTSDFADSLLVKCLSSASSAECHTVVDWNDAVSCSEVGDGATTGSTLEEDTKTSIPVRAYFFSTRFNFFFSQLVEIGNYFA